jgi:hypothetical protein
MSIVGAANAVIVDGRGLGTILDDDSGIFRQAWRLMTYAPTGTAC